MTDICTPIKVDKLAEYLHQSNYDRVESEFIIDGFTNGFEIGYAGPKIRQDRSRNIPFSVGDKFDMWQKLMKEVKLGRVAGPFEQIPFQNYMQSPIGLVPKGEGKTRLIFHLSYEFKSGLGSLNSNTPKHKCSVHYNDLDDVIANCINLIEQFTKEHPDQDESEATIFYSKTDLTSAFRILGLKIADIKWLIMKAENPRTGKIVYFVDKCLPFGASISCSHFQRVSNCLKHITGFLIRKKNRITNYMDDFLFIDLTKCGSNYILQVFRNVCDDIAFPVSEEKTCMAEPLMIFLGALLNGVAKVIAIPEEKRIKALNLIQWICSKRKATVKDLQRLAGLLNFLNRVIFPGRAFTRRIYAITAGHNLRPFHHIRLTQEFKDDCEVWRFFLESQAGKLFRPFVDLKGLISAQQIGFTTDASAAKTLGFGCVYNREWCFGRWPEGFINNCKPSIEFLELYALVVGVFLWSDKLANQRIVVLCDNISAVHMVNNFIFMQKVHDPDTYASTQGLNV